MVFFVVRQSFQENWYGKFTWLHYNIEEDAAFLLHMHFG